MVQALFNGDCPSLPLPVLARASAVGSGAVGRAGAAGTTPPPPVPVDVPPCTARVSEIPCGDFSVLTSVITLVFRVPDTFAKDEQTGSAVAAAAAAAAAAEPAMVAVVPSRLETFVGGTVFLRDNAGVGEVKKINYSLKTRSAIFRAHTVNDAPPLLRYFLLLVQLRSQRSTTPRDWL